MDLNYSIDVIMNGMESVLPRFQDGVTLVFYYWIVVLLPMFVVRRMRPLIAASLRYSSIFVGAACWSYSLVATYRILGRLSVAIGLLFAGLGVVPIAIYGAVLRGHRDVFWNVLGGVVLTIAPRMLAKLIVSRPAKKAPPMKVIYHSMND